MSISPSLAVVPSFASSCDGIVVKAEASGGHGNSGNFAAVLALVLAAVLEALVLALLFELVLPLSFTLLLPAHPVNRTVSKMIR